MLDNQSCENKVSSPWPRQPGPAVDDSPLRHGLAYAKAGLAVLPIRTDGTKAPALRAGHPFLYQKATEAEVTGWFDRPKPPGVGVVCGAASGGLELLDFDLEAEATFPAWCDLVGAEAPGLVARLCVVRTPRPGFHIRYRVEGMAVPGSTKLAIDPAAPRNDRVLIETRGEGSYAVAPGSPPSCHETRRTWGHVAGPDLTDLATITPEEREVLIRCARSFDRDAKEDAPPRGKAASNGHDLRPGDDFDQRGPDWQEILGPHGWELAGQSGEERRWRRPGKDGRGWSATTGHCKGKDGADLFRVFSSNADPFAEGRAYGKFRAYSLLNHQGDHAAAARQLGKDGYGTPRKPARQRRDPPPEPPEEPTEPDQGEEEDAPRTGTRVILEYFRKSYRPVFKDGNSIRCADGQTVSMTEACAVPDTEVIHLLAGAINAPRVKGKVNYNALPRFFSTWSRVAWGDLRKGLPLEEDADLAELELTREEFRRLVVEAMLSEVVLGETYGLGKDQQTRVERRSLIDWCQRFAKEGPWRSVRSKRCFCKLVPRPEGGELILKVAIRHEVFSQLTCDRRLKEMGPKKFSRRAGRYEVGSSTEKDRPHGKPALVLSDDVVDYLVDAIEVEQDGGSDEGEEFAPPPNPQLSELADC